jgi:hypothetical protein
MPINEGFKSCFNNLLVDNEDDIFQKIKRIVRILNKQLYDIDSDIDHSYIVGSFGRNTAIKGVSDLDIIFALPADLYYTYHAYQNNGQSALLQKIRNIIRLTYSQTDIRGDGQVVVIQFAGFKIELCPGFLQVDNNFIYPDSNCGGCWKVTKPLKENGAMRELNVISKHTLVRLCRYVRAWKNKFGLKLGGLLIDTWCYDFLEANTRFYDENFDQYPELIRDFFSYLSSFSADRRYWYSPVARQKVYKKVNINRKVKKSLEIASFACDLEDVNRQSRKYRALFGKAFPYTNTLLGKAENISNNEEFVEDKFQLDVIYSLRIDCRVSQEGYRTELLRNLKVIRHRKSLIFFISHFDAPRPFKVYWKIKNLGELAIQKNMIRGEIIKDMGHEERKETSTFNGPHYVECYIVKERICVARARINVPVSL